MEEAKSYAARNRAGSDWFAPQQSTSPSHQPAAAPVKVDDHPASPPAKADNDAGRAQLIKPVCNSNQWYKYDTAAAAAGNGESAKVQKESHVVDATPSQTQADHNAVTKEGDANSRRDKAGSWYSHDGAESTGVTTSSRVVTTEGSNNANRMRQSSENWFSHDGGASNEPLHVSKGRANRPQSSDMHHIFHMDGGK